MTTYYCISTNVANPWNSGSYWSLTDGGGAAGAYPVAGDTAYVKTGKAIGIPFYAHCYRLLIHGGTVLLRYSWGLMFDDTAGAGLDIDDTNSGGFYTNSTFASSAAMLSASTIPTNPWTISVKYIDGADARTLSFAHIVCSGMSPVLGYDSTNRIVFNLAAGSAWINNVQPLFREPILIEHQIDGRPYSRVYQHGGKAGVTTISGFVTWESRYHELLQEMLDGMHRLYFFDRYVRIPRCRVSGKISAPTKPGQLVVPFSLMLIEDR